MRTIFYTLLLTILLTSCTSEEERITESFHNFKTAILNHKGKEAATYAHRNLSAYFSYILGEVRYADSADVNSYAGKDKFLILLTRHLCTKKEVSKFNGNTLMSFIIDKWTVGKNDIASLSMGKIQIDENKQQATGRILSYDLKTPFYIDFYKEDNLWKIDLSSVYAPITRGFRKMINNSGMEENEFMFQALQEFNGEYPNNKIWHNVLRRPIIKVRKRS